MTLVQAAEACGMHHGQLSRIEHGQFKFLNENVQKICKLVGVDPEASNDLRADKLHAHLDKLIREKPGALAALRAVFEALDQMAN